MRHAPHAALSGSPRCARGAGLGSSRGPQVLQTVTSTPPSNIRDSTFGGAEVLRNSEHSRTHHSTAQLLSSVTFWEMSVLLRVPMAYSSTPYTRLPAPTTGVTRYGQQGRAHPRGDRRDRQLRRRRRRRRRPPGA